MDDPSCQFQLSKDDSNALISDGTGLFHPMAETSIVIDTATLDFSRGRIGRRNKKGMLKPGERFTILCKTPCIQMTQPRSQPLMCSGAHFALNATAAGPHQSISSFWGSDVVMDCSSIISCVDTTPFVEMPTAVVYVCQHQVRWFEVHVVFAHMCHHIYHYTTLRFHISFNEAWI